MIDIIPSTDSTEMKVDQKLSKFAKQGTSDRTETDGYPENYLIAENLK